MSTFECKNNLICLNLVCKDVLYKIPPGEQSNNDYSFKYGKTNSDIYVKKFMIKSL